MLEFHVKRGIMRVWWLLFLTSMLLLWYHWNTIPEYHLPRKSRVRHKQAVTVNLTDNYFWQALEKTRGALLVNTPKCRLPAFDPFDPSVMGLIHPWTSNCHKNIKITYTENQTVVINETEVKVRGYSLQNISCCYRTIERVERSEYRFDMHIDNRIRYSGKCYPMNLTTEPVSGFIEVNCSDPGKNETIYQNFHVLLKLSHAEQQRIQPKFTFWKQYAGNLSLKKSGHSTPPNVLILGLDSTSRQHFHRSMGKTRKLLEKIGAVDMKGYTRIGSNTCLNIFNVLVSHSYSPWKVSQICSPIVPYPSSMDTHDFIWNHFSNQNYVTGYFEDAPGAGNFNREKPGFLRAPTDLYLRPWMLAAYSISNDSCLGYQRSEEVILNYIEESVALLKEKHTPYFFTIWLTELVHGHINGLQGLDAPLSTMIRAMNSNGMLENTVLIVMGDHGHRKGKILETTSGWFEINLPVMYIRVPESLKKRFPDWQEALEHNSQVLTSHWDTHETLKDILRLISPNALNSTSPRGSSFLEKIQSRNCKDANIPSEYCVCLPDNWQISLNSSVIKYCVEKVIDKINDGLPAKCAEIFATTVKAVTIKNKTKNESVSTTDYIIYFETMPRNFTIEALVTYDSIAGKVMRIPRVERADSKTQTGSCLQEYEAHLLESFCVCK